MLQCFYSALQFVAVHCSVLGSPCWSDILLSRFVSESIVSSCCRLSFLHCSVWQCCRVLQCFAVRCSVFNCVAVCCSVLRCIRVYSSVLRCIVSMNKTCHRSKHITHTCECVVFRSLRRPATHMNASCAIYAPVLSHVRTSHVTCMKEACHIYKCVTSHTWLHDSCLVWMGLGTHINESCHTYEWVMLHKWKSHATRMDQPSYECKCVT